MKAALSGGFFCFSVGFRSQNRLATSQLRQCGVDAGQPVFRVAILDIVDDLGFKPKRLQDFFGQPAAFRG